MKAVTVLSVVGIIGTMGGLEHGMFGIGGWLIRTAVFMFLFVGSVVCTGIIEERKRARVRREQAVKRQKKKASGKCEFPKAQKTNKSYKVCHH